MSRAHFLDSAIVWRLATGAAWALEMVSTSVPHKPLRRHPDSQTPKVYQVFFRNAKMARYRLFNDLEVAVYQHLLAYGFASPPQGPSRRTSPINIPAPIAILRVPRRLGQDATTRLGGLPRVILI